MSKDKVYCHDCKYMNIKGDFDDFTFIDNLSKGKIDKNFINIYCSHPLNVLEELCDTWYTWFKKPVDIKTNRHPSEINANNDCPMYEKEILKS